MKTADRGQKRCVYCGRYYRPDPRVGSRGPAPKLTLLVLFNYVLKFLYMGCQWKELPIERDKEGHPEIQYTRIHKFFRRWQKCGYFNAMLSGSVGKLHENNLLDTSILHGDGTMTAAKKEETTLVLVDIKR